MPAERDLTLAHLLDAPRELVFKVWTQPGHLTRWWGPVVSRYPACTVDCRTGGKYGFCMRTPDGPDHRGGRTQCPGRLQKYLTDSA